MPQPGKGLVLLPIRDLNPSSTRAVVNWAIVIFTALVFFVLQNPQEPGQFQDKLYGAATIPCEVTTGEALSQEEIVTGRCQVGDEPVFADKNI